MSGGLPLQPASEPGIALCYAAGPLAGVLSSLGTPKAPFEVLFTGQV